MTTLADLDDTGDGKTCSTGAGYGRLPISRCRMNVFVQFRKGTITGARRQTHVHRAAWLTARNEEHDRQKQLP